MTYTILTKRILFKVNLLYYKNYCRNTIKKLFPEKLLERQEVLNNDQDNKVLLRKFADYGKKIGSSRGRQEQTNRNGHNFKSLVLLLVILCGVIVVSFN